MKQVPRWWQAPMGTFLAILLTAGPLGYGGRYLGVLIFILLVYFPIVLSVCLTLLLAAIAGRRSGMWRSALLSFTIVILLTPATLLTAYGLHDRIAFLFWYPPHQALLETWQGKSGVITHWDSWGMAGAGTDAVLISAPTDTRTDAAAIAAASLSCFEPSCAIGIPERMSRGLYIVTVE